MRIEEKLILELCRQQPDGAAVAAYADSRGFDWSFFMELAAHHMVAPTVFERLAKADLPDDCRDQVKHAGKTEIVGAMSRRYAFLTELSRIRGVLNGSALPWILLKGLSLDFTGLRTCGDMDILVREEDLRPALDALSSIGYRYVGDTLNRVLRGRERADLELQRGWNNQYQVYNPQTGLMVELHTNLFERRRVYTVNLDALLDGIETFWADRVFSDELGCYILSHEHLLLLMCLHNALKRSPGENRFVVRNLMDIDALVASRRPVGSPCRRGAALQDHALCLLFARSGGTTGRNPPSLCFANRSRREPDIVRAFSHGGARTVRCFAGTELTRVCEALHGIESLRIRGAVDRPFQMAPSPSRAVPPAVAHGAAFPPSRELAAGLRHVPAQPDSMDVAACSRSETEA